MKNLFLVVLLAVAGTASAGNITLLETPVTFHPEASASEMARKECQLEEKLEHRIGTVLTKVNRVRGGTGTIAKGADTAGASLLRIQITHVLGVGGGMWSGPKAITVSADIIDNGKVVRHTKINRWSIGGMFGGFKGTCSILNRSVIAIGKDLGRWVRDPSYQIVEEPAPKEGDNPKEEGEQDDASASEESAASKSK